MYWLIFITNLLAYVLTIETRGIVAALRIKYKYVEKIPIQFLTNSLRCLTILYWSANSSRNSSGRCRGCWWGGFYPVHSNGCLQGIFCMGLCLFWKKERYVLKCIGKNTALKYRGIEKSRWNIFIIPLKIKWTTWESKPRPRLSSF